MPRDQRWYVSLREHAARNNGAMHLKLSWSLVFPPKDEKQLAAASPKS